MTFCWWQMVIATRCCLDRCLLTVTVEPLWTGHSLFLILSHLSTFSNFHPSIDILVPSRSAHKPAKRKSLSRHIYRLDTAYTNIYKQKCTPKTNKGSVSQLSGDRKRERFETYTVLCFVFGLRCLGLCFKCVCCKYNSYWQDFHLSFIPSDNVFLHPNLGKGLLCPYRDQFSYIYYYTYSITNLLQFSL